MLASFDYTLNTQVKQDLLWNNANPRSCELLCIQYDTIEEFNVDLKAEYTA